MTPQIGTKWECTNCGRIGMVTRVQQEDYDTTQTARCPHCYAAVRIQMGARA